MEKLTIKDHLDEIEECLEVIIASKPNCDGFEHTAYDELIALKTELGFEHNPKK